MQVNYTKDALKALSALVIFIEENNTKGAGLRWLNKFEIFLKKSLKNNSVISLCHNNTFRQLNLKCLYYNDWIIAFSQSARSLTIEAVLHKSRIKD